MVTESVISQLSIKNTSDSFPIGPELKYSGCLPASNNHNLEEQMLMGVDRIVTSRYNETEKATIEIIEFRDDSRTENYYILTRKKYDSSKSDIYANNDELCFSTTSGVVAVTDELDCTGNNGIVLDSSGTILFSPTAVIEEDLLQYQGVSGTNLVDISSKKVESKFVSNKYVVKETITKK